MKNTSDNVIMIHGHRNVFNIPAKVNERIYNLCDEIEYGGNLRIAEITEAGIEIKLIPNPVYDAHYITFRYPLYMTWPQYFPSL